MRDNAHEYELGTWLTTRNGPELYEVIEVLKIKAGTRYQLVRHYPPCTGDPYKIMHKESREYFQPCPMATLLYKK